MGALEHEIRQLTEEFEDCQKLLVALGDESRQRIIFEMMKMEGCSGARVGEITERTHLSRPAVSHHLQILKDAGVVKRRKEGTKNYYYFDSDTKAMGELLHLVAHAESIMERLPKRDSEGQTALITGASGGLGKEFAIIFARRGFDLVLVARSADKLAALEETLSKQYKVKVTSIPADLSEADGAEKVYRKLQEKHIFIDQLVNNAGAGKQAATVEADVDTLRGLINLNAVSLTLLCRLIGADMVKAGHGRILNVSSLGAFIPDPYFNVYGPTKAFELFLTQAMYGELIGTGVSVSVLCPGPIKTNWAKNAGKADSKTAKEPAEVALAGYQGMQKGKLLIVPAPIYQIERCAIGLLPMTARIRVIRKWQSGLIKKNQSENAGSR